MSLTLEYQNTQDDLRNQYKLLFQEHYLSTRSKYSQKVASRTCLLILASYCAYQADHIGLFILFIVVAVIYLFDALPYSRIYWESVEESLVGRAETHIKLEIREDGLFETEEGIQSFVPWSSIKSYTVFKDTLFITLTAGLCAIVPRRSVTPSPPAVDELIRVLQDNGIAETTG